MSKSISTEASLFISQIENRRFSTGTLQILESILVARDVVSLLETRSALRELLRSQSMSVLGETSTETTVEKLQIAEFFVRAFALVGDVESCLALKYEALILREGVRLKDNGLQVSYEEWLTFARDSLDNGFYTIAAKGFENALMCIKSDNNVDPGPAAAFARDGTINEIKRLRDMATALVASHSVQTQSAEYLKWKAIQVDLKPGMSSIHTKSVASSVFRYGIKKRNILKLYCSRALSGDISGTQTHLDS